MNSNQRINNFENGYVFRTNRPTIILIVDPENGDIVDANDGACNFYLYSKEEILKKNICEINTLPRKELFKRMKEIKLEISNQFIFHHRLSNGEIKKVKSHSGPIKINNRSLIYSIVNELTDKDEFRKLLKQSNRDIRQIFNKINDPIVLIEFDEKNDFKSIIDVNNETCLRLGYTREELFKLSPVGIRMLFAKDEDIRFFKNELFEIHRVTCDITFISKEGKKILTEVNCSLLQLYEKNMGIMVVRDITTKKKYEEALKAAKIYAEEANNIKTQFLANMSHEIRTPINGIIGIVDLLKDTYLNSQQKEYISLLKYSADRLLVIINDILDITKIEAGKFDIENDNIITKTYFGKTVKYFELQAKAKKIKFFSNIDTSIPKIIIGDADKINKVLFNLLSNAIKFTEKGHIILRIQVVKKYKDSIELEFSVRDTGIGIQQSDFEDIFEGFRQVDSLSNKKYEGTGLGLTITKKLIELMGGRIKVDSQYGSGSTFTVTLKLGYGELEENKKSNKEDLYLNPKKPLKLNILLAEDDYINQKIIKRVLEKNNWIVTEVFNGKEVLRRLEEKYFDIIIMDINMPEMDGYETTKLIREKEKNIHVPIIAMTAAAMKQDKEKCLGLGMDAYISKPVKPDNLNNIIINVLNGNLNLKNIIERFDGDEKLLCEIIEDIICSKYEKEFIGNMEKYIQNSEWEKLKNCAHKFKGSISYFQSSIMLNLIEEIKRQCQRGDLHRIEDLFTNLKEEFIELKGNLKNYQKMICENK